ncbi:MAG: zincin-like metallopeptidase domain-containing protein [Pseudomonadota bacterium]
MNKSMQKVVDTIQAHMQEGELIWHNPCTIQTHSNLITGKPYTGINAFVLAMVAWGEGYESPYWATFSQVKKAGGKLDNAKGKGIPILFYKELPSEDDDREPRSVVRHSFIFNLDHVTGIDLGSVNTDRGGQATIAHDADALASAYLARENIRVCHGSPAYVPALDTIRMPHLDEVTSTDEFYSCYFHELAHSSGAEKRLGRFDASADRFESKAAYSQEELVAEITAAMLCHDCGVDSEASIKNSAAYVQGWTRFLRDQSEAFVTAVSQAYRARAFIWRG